MKEISISHYTLLEKLGEGGMGVVYKAKDTKLDRHVALKLLSPNVRTESLANKRFIQEAKSTSALDHPNVCTIYEIGETEDGKLYISMAYYDGKTLEDYLKDNTISYDEALDFAIQMAKGLSCAHRYDIIHRDVKPSNIMITDQGLVKIVDFGLAKLSGQATKLTQTGSTLGTAGYMSPEQISSGTIDHRSDIFSLGIVLYEMFAGVHPFKGVYSHAQLYSIMNDDPEPITKVNPDLPVELEWILSKALEKDPDNRFQDMAELQNFLEALKDDTLTLDQKSDLSLSIHSLPKKKSKSRKDNRTFVYALAATALVLFITLTLIWIYPTMQSVTATYFSSQSLPASKEIAVLPFRNIGDDPENRAFADGLLETITSKLSQLEQFQDQYLVVPASETRSMDIQSASQARTAFDVNLVVTGSVQKLSEGIRVTINLIDAETLRQIDSIVIDETFIDNSTLQDNAVFNLANMLQIDVQPEARTVLTAGQTAVPGAYEYYLQGLGHLQRFDQLQEINTAIERFERALEEDSTYSLAYAALGDAYLYKYRRTDDTSWLETAIENIQKALELEDRLSPIYTTYGVLLIEMGEYENANQQLEKALSLDPKNVEAYRARARAFMAQERSNEAEATYRKAIEMKPGFWAGYAELGVFYSQAGRFEEAAEQFSIVTELTPNNAAAYRNLGAVYYYLNRPEEALQAFNRSVEIEPNYGVYSNLGTMYYYEGDYQDAAEMYTKALELNDTDYQVWSFLSSAYNYSDPPQPEKSNDAMIKAMELAEERLEVNPRDAGLLIDLASFYAELGNEQRAEVMLNRSINLQPGDVTTQTKIGTVLEHLGDREGALEWFGKAIENGYPVEEIYKSPDPKISLLIEDPAFQEMVEKLQPQQ
jgi:serine/threonine-protein kinase